MVLGGLAEFHSVQHAQSVKEARGDRGTVLVVRMGHDVQHAERAGETPQRLQQAYRPVVVGQQFLSSQLLADLADLESQRAPPNPGKFDKLLYFLAVMVISMRAWPTRLATATVVRAGGSLGKYSLKIALIWLNSEMSVR